MHSSLQQPRNLNIIENLTKLLSNFHFYNFFKMKQRYQNALCKWKGNGAGLFVCRIMTKNWRKTRNHYHYPSERTGNSLVFISADDNLIARENAKDVIVTSYRTPLKIPGCEIKQCHWHRRSFCTIPSCIGAGSAIIHPQQIRCGFRWGHQFDFYEMKIINSYK